MFFIRVVCGSVNCWCSCSLWMFCCVWLICFLVLYSSSLRSWCGFLVVWSVVFWFIVSVLVNLRVMVLLSIWRRIWLFVLSWICWVSCWDYVFFMCIGWMLGNWCLFFFIFVVFVWIVCYLVLMMWMFCVGCC